MASRQKIILALTFLSLSFFTIDKSYSAENKNKIKYEADSVSYEKGPKIITLKGKVKINVEYYNAGATKPETVELYGEEIDVDLDKKIASSDKKFKIKTRKTIKEKERDIEIIGKSFDFAIDIKRLNANFSNVRMDADVEGEHVFLAGEQITVYNNGDRINAVKADLTTCDHIDQTIPPHYNIKADTIDFISDDRVLMWNSSIFINQNKVYWYPFFYIPLKKNGFDFNLDAGKNAAEGMFVNFKNYYNLNDFHDGTWFMRVMEKKWLGLGFEHTWLANPTSQTYLFAYGNVLNSDYFLTLKPEIRETMYPVFEDHEVLVEHRQWLPILPFAQTDFAYHKKYFYNINTQLSPKDNFSSYEVKFTDKEIFQPVQGLNIGFNPNLNASYEERITSNINQQSGLTIIDNKNKVLNLGTDTKINFNENINFGINSTFSNTIRDDSFNKDTANTSINNLNKQFFKAADNLDFKANLDFNYNNILPGLSFTARSNYTNTDSQNFSKPENANLPSKSIYSPTQINQSLNTTASLIQDLNWGKLSLTIDNTNDFLEDKINIKDSTGSVIPFDKLSAEQKTQRESNIDLRQGKSYVNRLPQLDLILDPLFNDFIPLNLSGGIGRLLEATTFPKDNSTGLLDLVKTDIKANIGSKDLDLGLGNKINLGGTGYEQNFYQTQDAQYKFTTQFNYKNDLSKYFIPSFNYRKVVTDDQNNTPFSNDRFSRDKQDQIIGEIGIGNIPEFNLKLGQIGYDFMNKTYFDPNISLNTDFIAGMRFQISANTSYRFNNIKKDSLTQKNMDRYTKQEAYVDKNKIKYDLARLNDTDFSEMYLGYSKSQAQQDISSLTEEQMKNKYGIDKRLYDITRTNIIDNTNLTENDIGRFELRGGKFNPLTLTLGLATPWEFNQEGDFGKDDNIPWGFATALSTSYDFQAEDYYKPKKLYGVLQPITEQQRNENFFRKFSGATALNTLFVIGGNWQTHTVINVDLSLIQPENIAEGATSNQTNRPFLPFNTYISVKKNFHDFILSFDFQNQYVERFNKQDFMFSVNLELTAFALNLKELADKGKGELGKTQNMIQQIK